LSKTGLYASRVEWHHWAGVTQSIRGSVVSTPVRKSAMWR